MTLRVGSQPVYWIAAGSGGVWATSGQRVVRIDPTTDKIVARFPIFNEPTGLATGLGAAWVTTKDSILAVSPRGDVKFAPHAFAGNALAPAVGAGSMWVIVYQNRGEIQALDPVTLTYSPGTETSAYPLDLAVSRRSVWAVDLHGTILRIDPASADVVARIPTAPTARSAIAIGSGAIWVAIEDPQ